MTRVNLIPPSKLTDQHLVAEYRELPMVPASLRRSLVSKFGLPFIPEHFLLGTGHVCFFYDKGAYLDERYHKLVAEMKHRGMKPDPDRGSPLHVFPKNLRGTYVPTRNAYTIIKRIAERIAKKPNWYRYFGQPIPERLSNYYEL